MCTAFHDDVGSTQPVVMADDGVAGGVAGPVAAGCDFGPADHRAAVRVRARQDVVDVGRVARPVHHLALLGEGVGLSDVVAIALRVSVQLVDVASDEDTLDVVPGAAANPIARVDGRGGPGRGLAQIRAPRAASRTGRLCQRLTVFVGAREAAQVRAIAETDAGDEKAHWLLWSLRFLLRRLSARSRRHHQHGDPEKCGRPTNRVLHRCPSWLWVRAGNPPWIPACCPHEYSSRRPARVAGDSGGVWPARSPVVGE